MLIEIQKKDTKEIQLPYFFKLDYKSIRASYFAIFTQEKSMRVDPEKEITCTDTKAIGQHFLNDAFVEIYEAEFTEQFETTIEFLTSMMPVTK